MSVKPVWVWLPHSHEPVLCGNYTLDDGIGRFEYWESYLDRHGAVALDPLHLPISRPCLPATETRLRGLFGVFYDIGPCDFGKSILEEKHGLVLDDTPVTKLELADGDGIGAVALGENIEAKTAYQPPASEELFDRLRRLPEDAPCGQAIREMKGVSSTNLAPQRPKLTVLHEGQHWLAKLQDPRSGPHAPLREFVAMRVGAAAGLSVAEVRFYQVANREVLLVRRFDREIVPRGKTWRRLYASAHTVLGLGQRNAPDERCRRSYIALANDLEKFSGGCFADLGSCRRELWRRMVFNVVCGNGDDHPANHGFIFQGGSWRLAPAFDIHPTSSYPGRQAMALNGVGSCVGNRATLLSDCETFGWLRAEAIEYIGHARQTLLDRWPAELEDAGFNVGTLPLHDPGAWLDA